MMMMIQLEADPMREIRPPAAKTPDVEREVYGVQYTPGVLRVVDGSGRTVPLKAVPPRVTQS